MICYIHEVSSWLLIDIRSTIAGPTNHNSWCKSDPPITISVGERYIYPYFYLGAKKKKKKTSPPKVMMHFHACSEYHHVSWFIIPITDLDDVSSKSDTLSYLVPSIILHFTDTSSSQISEADIFLWQKKIISIYIHPRYIYDTLIISTEKNCFPAGLPTPLFNHKAKLIFPPTAFAREQLRKYIHPDICAFFFFFICGSIISSRKK